MKFVLIIPPSPWLISDRDFALLGPLYISSYLKKQGYEVQVCDLSGLDEKDWFIPVANFYGITGVSPQFPYMQKIINKLKDRQPDCTVVVGGVHATVLPEHILNNTKADICVIGEGEHVIYDILRGRKLAYIPGIKTRDNKYKYRRLIKDLDSIPFPDVKGVDYYSYLKPQTYKYLSDSNEASIITSRGCPYHCNFCASYKMHQGRTRFRSAENVYDELKYLKSEFNIGSCYFMDDTFILNKKRVYKICRLIKLLDIKWYFLTRVDCVDEKLLSYMVDSGAVGVTIGFETGSNRILELMNKRATIEQADYAIKVCTKIGLKIRGQIMVGFPGETDDDVELTAAFIKRYPQVKKFGAHVFQAFPGCDVWENPGKYKVTINKDTNFNNYHTIGKPGAELTKDQVVNKRFEYIKSVIAERNIDRS